VPDRARWSLVPDRRLLPITTVLALLAQTPARISALTEAVSPADLHATPSPGEWSANDVLAHLRACADVWGGCMLQMISEERPTLRAVNPRSWIASTDYPGLAFAPSFRAFVAQRSELLAVLERLPEEGWSRTATVTGAGSVLERSVLDYGSRMARHERPHVKQIERTVEAVRR